MTDTEHAAAIKSACLGEDLLDRHEKQIVTEACAQIDAIQQGAVIKALNDLVTDLGEEQVVSLLCRRFQVGKVTADHPHLIAQEHAPAVEGGPPTYTASYLGLINGLLSAAGIPKIGLRVRDAETPADSLLVVAPKMLIS